MRWLNVLHGVYQWVDIINPYQNKKHVSIDACTAAEVQKLNNKVIITLELCRGHGRIGEFVEWKNDFGEWKSYQNPHMYYQKLRVLKCKTFGLSSISYYYADSLNKGVWQIFLKTRFITKKDCMEWHDTNANPYKEHLGLIWILINVLWSVTPITPVISLGN